MNISVRVESPPAAEQLLRVSESRSSTETADRGCDSDSRPRGMLTPLSPLAPSSPTLLWQFNQEGKDLTALEKFKREFPVGAKMACTPVSDYFTDVRHHYPPLEWKAELRKYGPPFGDDYRKYSSPSAYIPSGADENAIRRKHAEIFGLKQERSAPQKPLRLSRSMRRRMSGNAIHKLPPRERSLRRSTISGSSRATLLGTSEGSGSGDGAHMSSIKGFASKWRNRKANRVASDARMSQRYHVIRGRLPEFQTALRKRMSNRSIDDHHLATSPILKTALQRAKGRICSNALLSDESDSEGLSCSEVEEDYWDSDDDRRRNLGETLWPAAALVFRCVR